MLVGPCSQRRRGMDSTDEITTCFHSYTLVIYWGDYQCKLSCFPFLNLCLKDYTKKMLD